MGTILKIMNKNAKRNKWDQIPSYKRRPLNIKEFVVKNPAKLLDFLYEIMPDSPKSKVKGILKSHCVSIDGAPVSQFDFMVSPGDTVIISKTPIRTKNKKDELKILYEDNDFIAIDKPYGVLSVASDKEKSNTAYRMVTSYVQSKDKHNRIFVVHRIDRETSGVLLFAKSEKMRDLLQDDWNKLVTDRGYFAICDGVFKEKSGVLKAFLRPNNANMMSVVHDKRDQRGAYFCITKYKVLKENDNYSLLDVHIDSGRKNQIRVMLGSIGHFVSGDDKYGEPSDPLQRLCLHAYKLELKNPITNKTMLFETHMPKEFLSLFSNEKLPEKKDIKRKKKF